MGKPTSCSFLSLAWQRNLEPPELERCYCRDSTDTRVSCPGIAVRTGSKWSAQEAVKVAGKITLAEHWKSEPARLKFLIRQCMMSCIAYPTCIAGVWPILRHAHFTCQKDLWSTSWAAAQSLGRGKVQVVPGAEGSSWSHLHNNPAEQTTASSKAQHFLC